MNEIRLKRLELARLEEEIRGEIDALQASCNHVYTDWVHDFDAKEDHRQCRDCGHENFMICTGESCIVA